MEELKKIALEVNRKKRVNRLFNFTFIALYFSLILWAIFNQHENSLGEQIFLGLSLFVLAYGIYISLNTAKILPPPKENSESIWKEYLILKLERMVSANTLAEWRVIYPLFICSFGIFSMEFSNTGKIWSYLLIDCFVIGLLFWYTHRNITYAKRKYKEVTGNLYTTFHI